MANEDIEQAPTLEEDRRIIAGALERIRRGTAWKAPGYRSFAARYTEMFLSRVVLRKKP